jgi:uncharacterized protein Usg
MLFEQLQRLLRVWKAARTGNLSVIKICHVRVLCLLCLVSAWFLNGFAMPMPFEQLQRLLRVWKAARTGDLLSS